MLKKKKSNVTIDEKTKKGKKAKYDLLFVDKPIEDKSEDILNITEYVDSLNNAIEQGASFISINSSYGAGKSSVCNLLKTNRKYNKVSTVSLWDAVIDKPDVHKCKKNQLIFSDETKKTNAQIIETDEENNESEEEALSYYKSFLYKLSSDYNSIRNAKYVSGVLNKKTGLFTMLLRNNWLVLAFCVFVFCVILFLVTSRLDLIRYRQIEIIKETLTQCISENSIMYQIIRKVYRLRNIIEIGSIIIGFICTLIVVFKGKVVYSSWKVEKDRLLTTEDIIDLYIQIIKDAVRCGNRKKNLIIIEDIDRNIDDNYNVVIDFIKSMSKLNKHTCRDPRENKKLKSIVFIFCIDEQKLVNAANKHSDIDSNEQILKLFDYRLDLGVVHYDNFKGFMRTLLENNNIENVKELGLLLNSSKNNIRLLKNELNDCFLKYRTLKTRFGDNVRIRLEACAAYSFIKNNYPNCYYLMQKDEKITESILKAVRENNAKINSRQSNYSLNLELGDKYSTEFKETLESFIKESIIDEEYRMYFYNYPSVEKYRNVNEHLFWKYITGRAQLDIENNEMLTEDYIKEVAEDVIEQKLSYPENIIDDIRTIKILLTVNNKMKLKTLFGKCFSLDNVEKVKKLIKFIKESLQYEYNLDVIKEIIEDLYENEWSKNLRGEIEEINELRLLLTRIYQTEIVKFEKLFQNPFSSISIEEHNLIKNSYDILKLINVEKFDTKLESLILNVHKGLTEKEKLSILSKWRNNIITPKNYVKYSTKLLSEYKKYAPNTLKSLIPYKELLKDNDDFVEYLNTVIEQENGSNLQSINNYAIDFGLNAESINKFEINGLYLTPIVFYLQNNLYEKLAKAHYETEIKKMTDVKYRYLATKIIGFKKYLLDNDCGDRYYELFTDKTFSDIYPLQIDWVMVNNVDLLVTCNIDNPKVIRDYLDNSVYINSDNQLEKLLKKVYLKIPTVQWEKHDLIGIIITKYGAYCRIIRERNNIFEEIIDKISSDYRYEIMIKYQICINEVVLKYCNKLKLYTGIYKKEYVEFINKAYIGTLSDDVILSLNLYYPYKKEIINRLIELNQYKIALGSSILKEDFDLSNTILNVASLQDIVTLYNYSTDFKVFLFSCERFIDIVTTKMYDFQINYIDICATIEKYGINISLSNKLFNYIDSEMIKNILLNINSIKEPYISLFLFYIFDNQKIADVIIKDFDVQDRIRSILPKSYKSAFSKKLNKLLMSNVNKG